MIGMQMKITVDPQMKQLIEGLRKCDTVVRETVWDGTLQIAEAMEGEIKEAMPVDTGRAKASWGRFTPGDLVKGSKRITKSKTGKRVRFRTGPGLQSEAIQIASAADAIWVENEGQMSILQGTEVPYTVYLEQGHAEGRGHPGAFIQRAFENAMISYGQFSEALARMINGVLTGKPISLRQVFRMRIPGTGGVRRTFRI